MDLPGLLTEIAFRHLWQGTLIVGIVSLLLSARNTWSAEHRSWMWSIALVLVATLPLFTLIDLPELKAGAAVPAGATIVPLSSVAAPAAQPAFHAPVTDPLLALAGKLPMVLILSAMAAIWVGVAVWKLFRLASAARQTGALGETLEPCLLSTDMVPADWPETVDILQSDKVETPMAIGLVRCRVVLPASLVATLPAHQICHVLSHELAHIRRGDLQFAVIERLIQAMFWWSPLAWFIGKQLHEEREMACDDRAVQMNGCSRQYANALLESVTLLVAGRRSGRCDMLALSAFDHHSRTAFRTRIRRLIGKGYSARTVLGTAQIASGSVAILAVIALFLLSPRDVFETASIVPERPVQRLASLDGGLEFMLPATFSDTGGTPPATVQGRTAAAAVSAYMAGMPKPPAAPMSRFAAHDATVDQCSEDDGHTHPAPIAAPLPVPPPDPAPVVTAEVEAVAEYAYETRRERIASGSGTPRIEIETQVLDQVAADQLGIDQTTAEFVVVTRNADGRLVKRVIRHSDARDITITAANGSTMTVTIREDEHGNQVLSMNGDNSEIVTIN